MKDKEEVVMLEDKVNYYIPSSDIEHNFLLDTCALNRIVESNDIIDAIKKSKIKGYNYYISDVQMRELYGVIDKKVVDESISTSIKESNEKIFKFIEEINCKRVSCVALLLKNFWKLDGSFRLIDENAETYPMIKDIHNNNIIHIKDAVIAEAAVYNNCTLVTKDSRLNKKVNNYFNGRSLWYDDFTNKIMSLI